MNNLLKYSLYFLVLPSFLLFSCEDEEPKIVNPEELITTVIYTLTPDGGGNDIVLSFEDLDGDGGNAPSFIVEPLAANTTYTGSLQLLNKTESPAEDITLEIQDEDEAHQFFFSQSGLNISLAYNDMDGNGDPIGLSTKLITGDAGNGTLTITLRHEPDKSASGVSAGDITQAGGETDIEVNFSLTIQ